MGIGTGCARQPDMEGYVRRKRAEAQGQLNLFDAPPKKERPVKKWRYATEFNQAFTAVFGRALFRK